MINFRSVSLYFVVGAITLIGVGARWWLRAHMEIVDANDAAMVSIAETALFVGISASLLMVVIAHTLMDQERIRLREQLKKAQASINQQVEAESQQRQLAHLGVLAGSLAHELGQPLSAARVGIEGLHYLRQIGREPSPEHLTTTLSRVGMSILTMTQIVDHLRSLVGTPQENPLEIIDLTQHLDAIINDREQWLRFSDVKIQWHKPEQPMLALGNAAGLRLIVTNLLRNAVEAVASQTKERRFVSATVGPGTRVVIRDSGPGISEENLKTIFEPFITSKSGGVHGIGLPLAKVSAARMGGELSVTSALGSGATFTLRLREPHEAPSDLFPDFA
jgi:C4-dicarboxylate-specific signal transduction histidine kinase